MVLKLKKAKGSTKQQAIRMKQKEYETVSPGPGSYRIQSEFGIYSPDDATNRVEVHEITQAITTHRGSSPHLDVPPSAKRSLRSKRRLNRRLPISSSAGFSAVQKTLTEQRHPHQASPTLVSLSKVYSGGTPSQRRAGLGGNRSSV